MKYPGFLRDHAVVLMTLVTVTLLSAIPYILRYADPELSTRLVHHCFDDQTSLRTCIEKFYENDAKKNGVAHALGELKARLTYDHSVQAYCHETMHLIGRVAYKEYGSLGEAFVHGDYTCWSGYYHGAVEGALRGVHLKDITKVELQALCQGSNISEHSFEQFNCTHGIGHALMYLSNNDVPEALSRCDDLNDPWKEGHCATGVFMENSLADDDHPSKFLPTEDLNFPCTIVPERYGEACYLVQSTFVIKKANGDLSKAFAFCETLRNTSYRTQCARGLGKEVAERTFYSPQRTAEACGSVPIDMQSACLFGALQDFVGNAHDNNAGRAICAALTVPDRQKECSSTLGEISVTSTTSLVAK